MLKVKTKRRDLFSEGPVICSTFQELRNSSSCVCLCHCLSSLLILLCGILLAGEAPLWGYLWVDKPTNQKSTKEKSKWEGTSVFGITGWRAGRSQPFQGTAVMSSWLSFCLERKERKIKVMVSSSRRQELFVTVKYKVYSSFLFSHLLCFHCWIYFSPGYTGSSWEGKVCLNNSSLAIILK